jgi:hypothetical protein
MHRVRTVWQLLSVIKTESIVGPRDRAIFSILLYTAARAGTVGRLDVDHYSYQSDQRKGPLES